jgi:hypothetical protein
VRLAQAVESWHSGLAQNLEVFKAEADFASDCTRKMLTPEKCWYQKNADNRGMLTPEKCWYQKNADTKGMLTPEKC